MCAIPRRATKNSTCPTSSAACRPRTPRWPMADQTFRLPDLGEGLTEAQLVAWRVDEGATVEINTPLCDVETAKAVVVIPSPYAGTVQKLHAKPGETVAVGAALITIAAESTPHPDPPPQRGRETEAPANLVGYGPGSGPQSTIRRRARVTSVASEPAGDVRAAPFVRQLARERGIDLSTVTGTGPGGRITRADVEAAAGPATPTKLAAASTDGEKRI